MPPFLALVSDLPVLAVAVAAAQALLVALVADPAEQPAAVLSAAAAEGVAVVAPAGVVARKARSDAAEERFAGASPSGPSGQSLSRCKLRPSVVSTFPVGTA